MNDHRPMRRAVWMVLFLGLLGRGVVFCQQQQCRLCEHGTFCFLETQHICPTNSRSLAGSGNITDCVCLPGFFSTQHVNNDHGCQPCAPGRYCPGDESSVACPASSSSDAFAVGVADCFCVAGFAGSGGACAACAAGSAKAGNGPGPCVPCAPDSHMAAPAAGACAGCPPNTNTQNASGATSAAACVSSPGYFTSGGVVAPCAAGTFQALSGQPACVDCRQGAADNVRYTTGAASASAQLCLTCPQDSRVPGASSGASLASCLCDAGFTGADGGPCDACAPGSVKNVLGSAACAACLADQYADLLNVACVPCTTDSSSPPSSDNRTACICNAGFSSGLVAPFACTQCAAGTFQRTVPPALSTCQACAAGKFSNQARRTVCTDCPENTFQPNSGAQSCWICMTNSVAPEGNTASANCLCNPGFERVGALCVACKTGFFKSATSNAVCTQCGPGLVSPHTSTSQSQCVLCATGLYVETLSAGLICSTCQQHAQAPTGGTVISSCACRAGFTGPGFTMTPSPMIYNFNDKRTLVTWQAYVTESGGTTGINQQNANGWWGGTAQISWVVPANVHEFQLTFSRTFWHIGSIEMTLNNIVVHNGAGGTFKLKTTPGSVIMLKLHGRGSSNGCTLGFNMVLMYWSDACQTCPSGSYKAGSGNQTCTLCPAGHIGASMSSPGFAAFLAATGADALVRTSEHYCQACAVGSYEAGGVCASCHNGSSSTSASVGASACSCVAGHEPAGGGCAACLAGHYKTGGGNVACTRCGVGTYSAVVGAVLASVCQTCPANTEELSMARDGIHNCVCRPGFEALQAGVACAACAAGAFKSGTGSYACDLCPAGTFQPLSAGLRTSNTCQTCPEHSSSLAGSSLVAACVCLATFNRNASACVLCKLDHFCPDQNTQTRCPLFSTAAPGSVSVADCRCDAGFSRVGSACQLCRANTYCLDGVAESACPQNSTTLGRLGSVDRGACVCDGGFFESDAAAGTCSRCGADTFCANDVRLSCPSNASALAGSTSVAECLCDALFRRVGDACVLCADTQVCRGGGSAALACAGGGVNEHQLCVCAPGSYCSARGAGSCLHPLLCPACPEGSFCAGNNITACAPRSSALAGSASADACECVPGSFRTVSGECELCPADSYCSAEARTLCSAHDARLVTENAGASAKSACVCRAGDFRLTPTDLCKPCPLNFYCPAASAAQLSNVHACLANEYTAHTGSTSAAQCLCAVGFLLSADAGSSVRCIRCAPGQRCSGEGVVDEECHLQSRVANADHSKCVCLPGFHENSDLRCVVCAAPAVKSAPGDFACAACPADSSWRNTTHCAPCAANATSAEGSTACVCRAPQVLRDSACVACPADSFYISPGLCQPCPLASKTAAANYEVVPAVRSCLCVAGFERKVQAGALDRCEACPAGTYEAGGVCVSCGAGARSAPGSAHLSACECDAARCDVRVWDEFCAGGCEPALPACAQCAPGHAKAAVSAVGNTDPCTQCPLHTFQEAAGRTACDACHVTRQTLEGGRADRHECRCVAGWAHEPGAEACRACAPGHFKAALGDFGCSACAVGSFAERHNETACGRCDALTRTPHANTTRAMASDSVDDCTCLAGHFGAPAPPGPAARCAPCVVGSFKDAAGFELCSFCGTTIDGSTELHNTFGNEPPAATSHAHCENCPAFSGQDHAAVGAAAPMQGLAACVCMPGFDSFAAGGCAACGAYKHRLGFGAGACAHCAAGSAFTQSFQACVLCRLGTSGAALVHEGLVINSLDAALPWATSTLDCACSLGYVRRSDLCHACEAGSFRNESTHALCSPCALHSYQNATGSTGCRACPAHSFTAQTGRFAVEQCLCFRGYEWDGERQLCVACAPGFFGAHDDGRCAPCADRFYSDAEAQTQCRACAAHEFSLAPRDSAAACACDPGSGSALGNAPGASCALCPRGSFAAGGALGAQRPACLTCPAAKSTPGTGNSVVDACVCEPGHGDAAANADRSAPCVACTSGRYAPGGSNVPCAKCGFGTVTEPALGAGSFEQCMCNALLGLRVA